MNIHETGPTPVLVRASDDGGLMQLAGGMLIRGIREELREADFVASTDCIDSYEEIVEQVWQLERFLANPIALYAHQSRELPIGHCTRVGVVNGKLECTIQFCKADENPKAENVWLMVKRKTLRAVSVGFVPHTVRWEKRGDREVYVLSDNELHEISVVPIPANPEALAKMKAKALTAARERAAAPLVAAFTAATTPNETATPTPVPATELGTETIDMNEKEFQAKLDAKSTELAAAIERSTALSTQLAALTVDKGALEERATNAEKEREAALETVRAHESTIAKARKSLGAKDEGDAPETLEQAIERTLGEVKAQADTIITNHVQSFVGKKLSPAQAEVFMPIAKESKERFDAIVATLPDLHLLGGGIIPGSNDSPAPVNAAPGDELAALLDGTATAAKSADGAVDLVELMNG